MSEHQTQDSPFAAILRGDEEGVIVARDNNRRFAVIESLEPEAALHWLVVPFEAGQSTEQLERANPERFKGLVEYAIATAKAAAGERPELAQGFSIKIHFGAYETIPHAKLHVLSTE